MEFVPMPKVPRLSREVIITEKIDGTNASICIAPASQCNVAKAIAMPLMDGIQVAVFAGSRTRWITPDDDNYGFARWATEHVEELVKLGIGHHFGEWWGGGIQIGYGLPKTDKRWSLFNVARWSPLTVDTTSGDYVGPPCAPVCCDVVPVLYRGPFSTAAVEDIMAQLKATGSHAAPGFMDPEGVMVYHTAANLVFKKTIKGDAEGKSREAHPKKEREPRPPKNPSIGGRRKGLTPGYAGPERRAA